VLLTFTGTNFVTGATVPGVCVDPLTPLANSGNTIATCTLADAAATGGVYEIDAQVFTSAGPSNTLGVAYERPAQTPSLNSISTLSDTCLTTCKNSCCSAAPPFAARRPVL
jgi:hypothetical protein